MPNMIISHPVTCMLCLCVYVVRESLNCHGEIRSVGWMLKLMMYIRILKCLGCVYLINCSLVEFWHGFQLIQTSHVWAKQGARSCARESTPVCPCLCEGTAVCSESTRSGKRRTRPCVLRDTVVCPPFACNSQIIPEKSTTRRTTDARSRVPGHTPVCPCLARPCVSLARPYVCFARPCSSINFPEEAEMTY